MIILRATDVPPDLAEFFEPLDNTGRTDVFKIATQPTPFAHFATFPEKLIEPCILAGTSPRACEVCGAPWERVIERSESDWQARKAAGAASGSLVSGHNASHGNGTNHTLGRRAVLSEAWSPTCHCTNNTGAGRCVVLDPFFGSGTVGRVAIKHGRDAIGIELNPTYIELADVRTNGVQLSMEALV